MFGGRRHKKPAVYQPHGVGYGSQLNSQYYQGLSANQQGWNNNNQPAYMPQGFAQEGYGQVGDRYFQQTGLNSGFYVDFNNHRSNSRSSSSSSSSSSQGGNKSPSRIAQKQQRRQLRRQRRHQITQGLQNKLHQQGKMSRYNPAMYQQQNVNPQNGFVPNGYNNNNINLINHHRF